ncbi:MAG: ATP synthase F1 subunit delta [bacterium]
MRKYAKALLDIAMEDGREKKIGQEIAAVADLLRRNENLRNILYHPVVGVEKKKKLLYEVLKENTMILNTTYKFLCLLIDKDRLKHLDWIHSEYTRLDNTARNIVNASVITARPLKPELRERIVDALERYTEGKVLLDTKVDRSLIGGIVVQVGDRIIDASIRGELNRMRSEMEALKRSDFTEAASVQGEGEAP